jgi:hypothetical protein
MKSFNIYDKEVIPLLQEQAEQEALNRLDKYD